jgi:hypothetical protein
MGWLVKLGIEKRPSLCLRLIKPPFLYTCTHKRGDGDVQHGTDLPSISIIDSANKRREIVYNMPQTRTRTHYSIVEVAFSRWTN